MLNKLPLLFPWKHSKTKTAMAGPQPTAIATMEEEAVDVSNDLHPCSICGRTFLPISLEKHTRVCERNAAKKRKVFNSLKQRVEGTDLAPFHQRTYLKKPDTLAQKQEPPPRPNNWKQKHLELVNTIRAAKGVEPEIMSGQKRLTLGASTNEKCPSCDRHFGPKAYDRHVEWCKERKTTIHKSPAAVIMAKERLEARTKYRAPLNKTKRAATREKYSPQTSQTDSTSNMKSNSACTLDRSASMRKSKTVINKKSVETMNDYSSQDEQYHDRKDRYERDVGDVCAKQLASGRSDKEVNRKQMESTKGSDHYDPFISAERQFMELLECDDFKPFTSKSKPVTTQRPHTTDNKKAKSKTPSPAPTKKITKTDRSLSNKVLHKNSNNTKRASVIDPPADFRDRLSMLNDDFELIENLINETFTKNINTTNNNQVNKSNLYSKDDNESFSLNAILRGRKYSDDLSAIDPRLINENDDLSIPDHFNDQDSSPTSSTTLNCYDNSGYIDHFSESFESKIEPGKTTEIKLKQSISMLDDVSNSFLEDKQLDEFLITLKTPTNEKMVEDKVKPAKKAPKLSKLPKQISINSSAGMAGRKEDKKKNLQSLKRSMSTLDPVQKPMKPMKSNQDIKNYFNEQDQRSPTNMLSPIEIPRNNPDLTPSEELFSVDDAMYEEYKMFEEMYLKEKEEKMRKEDPRIDDRRSGTQTASEDDDSQQHKGPKVVSGDSAYGSLNRRTPKARATKTKLSPLESQKSLIADSPCSSSSESSPVPLSSAPKMSKYCHECGNRYPLAAAKFCVECGVKRLVL